MENKPEEGIAVGSKAAPEQFHIQVSAEGPYLVYGNPPLDQQIIVPNEERISWEYRQGLTFDSSPKCVALCRCGRSNTHPFCDGEHKHVDWDPRETASMQPFMDDVETYEGPAMILIDNEKLCALARFCDAHGEIWNIIEDASTEEEKELLRHEAGHCPAGRLLLYDKEKQEIYEPPLEPSISVLEDPAIRASGPLWVKGGIRIISANGKSYEIRNRVTLCRCGASKNKPFCDGAHAHIRFRDGLE